MSPELGQIGNLISTWDSLHDYLAGLKRVELSMRRRLREFLPIVLIALMVQILAPVAACWAASIAASDPLHVAAICHDDGASTPTQSDYPADQPGRPGSHDGCCSLCNLAHSGAPVDPPQTTVAMSYLEPKPVAWVDRAPDVFGGRAGCHAQARAPPDLT